jgi:hypothetical protein
MKKNKPAAVPVVKKESLQKQIEFLGQALGGLYQNQKTLSEQAVSMQTFEVTATKIQQMSLLTQACINLLGKDKVLAEAKAIEAEHVREITEKAEALLAAELASGKTVRSSVVSPASTLRVTSKNEDGTDAPELVSVDQLATDVQELLVGKAAGEVVRVGQRDVTIVEIFDAGATPAVTEISNG